MSKNIRLLVALFAVMVACSAVVLAEPKVEIKFVEDHLVANAFNLVDISFSGLSDPTLSDFTANVAPVQGSTPKFSDTYWKFDDDDNDLDRLHRTANPALALGFSPNACWNTANGQILAVADRFSVDSWEFYFSESVQAKYLAEEAFDAFSMRCSLPITTMKKPTITNLRITGIGSGMDVNLVWPTRGIITPVINFKGASIAQSTDDPFSSTELSIEFTADHVGTYLVQLINGASPYHVNLDSGKVADFFCSSSKTKDFARIQYNEDDSYSDIEPHVAIYVPEVTTEPIKCKMFFSNIAANNFVNSERQTATISFGAISASRVLSLKDVNAGASGMIFANPPAGNSLYIFTTPLALTNVSPQVNSTIEFTFPSEINVHALELIEDTDLPTSFRANSNCQFPATSEVDAVNHKIILRDINPFFSSSSINSVGCYFQFRGAEAVDFAKLPQTLFIKMRIDGKDLVSTQSPGVDIPLHFQTTGYISPKTHDETESNDVITVVDSFIITNANIHTIMRNPRLIINLAGPSTLTVENYKDNVTCQMATPTQSNLSPLSLKFDDKFFVWTADLKDLKNVEVYNVELKCTRTVQIIKQFGLDITPISSIQVTIVDVIGSKSFYDYGNLKFGQVGGASVTKHAKKAAKVEKSEPMKVQSSQSMQTQNTSSVITQASVSINYRVQTETQQGQYPNSAVIGTRPVFTDLVIPNNVDRATFDPQIKELFAKWVLNAKWSSSVEDFDLSQVGDVEISYNSDTLSAYNWGSHHYANSRPLSLLLDWQAKNWKDGMVAIDYLTLDSFSNLQPSSRQAFWEPTSNVAFVSVSMTVAFKLKAGKTTGTIPSQIEWTHKEEMFTNKYGEAVVPLHPDDSPYLTSEYATIPPTGCGLKNGMNLFFDEEWGYNFNTAPASTDAEKASKWSSFLSTLSSLRYTRCEVGQACEFNFDCNGNLMCSKNVCTELPQYLPPLFNLARSPGDYSSTALERYAASNASTASFIAAAMVIAVLALFL